MTLVQYALVVLPVGTNWTIEPFALVGVLAIGLLYAAAMSRLRRKGRNWPWKRWLPFAAGLLAIFLGTHSPLAGNDTRLFTAHVSQHLLLGMAAPVLLCLGAPITLLLQAARRPTQRRVLALLHAAPVRFVTHPVFSWCFFTGTLFVLYYSPLYQLSLENAAFHLLVHVHFMLAGFLFFAPIVAIDPHPHRMPHAARLAYMGLTLPAHAFLALALLSATSPLAVDWYVNHMGRAFEDVLLDQKWGASIMWISGDLLSIATVGVVVTQWIRDDERSAVREDRFVDLQEDGNTNHSR